MIGDPDIPVQRVTRLMDGFPHPWAVCGGWAIDLGLPQRFAKPHPLAAGMAGECADKNPSRSSLVRRTVRAAPRAHVSRGSTAMKEPNMPLEIACG